MKVTLEVTVLNENAKPKKLRAKRQLEFEVPDDALELYEALALDSRDVLIEIAKTTLRAGKQAAMAGGSIEAPKSRTEQAIHRDPEAPKLSRPGKSSGISEQVAKVVSSNKDPGKARQDMEDVMAIMDNLNAMEKHSKQPSPGHIGFGPHRGK